MYSLLITLLLLLGTALSGPVSASPITFAFTGNVNSVSAPLSGTFNTSQTLSGFYTFESTTPDTVPLDATLGFYTGALTALSFTVGSYTGTGPTLSGSAIAVENDRVMVFQPIPRDSYTAGAEFVGQDIAGLSPLFVIVVGLVDPTGTALNSDSLPTTPPNLSAFTQGSGFVLIFGIPAFPENEEQVVGTLTSLTLVTEPPGGTPIPEPSTWLLLSSGLAGIALWRQRHRQSHSA